MATSRIAEIPFEYVEAELAALPIASEESFTSPSSILTPITSSTSSQRNLWRAAERHILSAIPSIPLDEFATIRDKVWFGDDPNIIHQQPRILLVSFLRKLSRRYLDTLGRPVDLSSQSTRNRGPSPPARLRWSWLCRALPPDLLRTARCVPNPDDSPFQLVPSVERLLRESGFSETHLHLGAAADFSLLWTNLMHCLVVEEVGEKSFGSPGSGFNDGKKFGKWIMWTAIVRLILAEWLFGSKGSGERSNLLDFASATWRNRMDAGMVSDLHRLVSELARGREDILPVRFPRGRTLYRSLVRPSPFLIDRREAWQRLRARHDPKSRQDIFENDPLARVVGWHRTTGSSPETIFIRESLRFMEEEDEHCDFSHLFWQVTRIRCMLYRHLVQRSLTPGLQWFVRFYSRIKAVRQSLPTAVKMEEAMRQSGSRTGLRSLEVRLGIEESESECLKQIQQVNGVRTKPAKTEVGAVFHFSRDRGGDWKRGFLNAHGLDRSYPGIPRNKRLRTRLDVGNPNGFRFARFYLEQRRQAQALVSVLQGFPHALRTVRGVDLCTDEAGVPIWVMAPLIRWVREAGQKSAITLGNRGITGIPSLSTTVHAGEDFIHLLTGLRRLDDAIRYMGLEEGDRIGHGLALGLDPVKWFDRMGRIVQTREERLFDLVWEWDCYANGGVEVESVRLVYLQNTIARLARVMFGKSVTPTPEDLSYFVTGLHCERKLKDMGFPGRARCRLQDDTPTETIRDTLIRAYLCSTQVWRDGRVLETITFDELGHERRALNSLQRALRRKVGKLGLTLEINPSSNLMVADLGSLEEHPIWRLMPLHSDDEIPPVSICIGSDDPLTFATNLPHEYQLLFDTMVCAGQSHKVALDWLDRAREAGMRGRFTLPRFLTRCPKKLTAGLLRGQRPIPPP